MKRYIKICLIVLIGLIICGSAILSYKFLSNRKASSGKDIAASNKDKTDKKINDNDNVVSTPSPVEQTPDPEVAQPEIKQVKPFSKDLAFLRGINMGNGLEAPSYEGEWGLKIQDEHFKIIKDAGFNFVRIPIRWSAHSAKTAPYKIDDAFFKRIDQVINAALSQNLKVMINIHHFEEMNTAPEANKDKFLSLWSQISNHYKGYSKDLFFEILNEPCDKLQPYLWNDYLNESIKTIRATNPDRLIVVGPTNWNAISDLQYLILPTNDNNLIATFHFYDPFNFTHQGAEWATGMDKYLGTKWTKSTSEQTDIINKLNKVVAWAQKNNVHVIMGEFGAYGKADMASRALWTDYLARQAEKRNISWSYWEFGCGFGAYDQATQKWRPELLKALIPTE